MTPLTPAVERRFWGRSIERIRDTADSLVRYDNGQASDPRVRARWPIDASALQVRDLAATALELDRKLGEVTDDWQHCCAAEKAAKARIREVESTLADRDYERDELRARSEAAEARVEALEEGLRGLSEAVISSVHDGTHGDIPARECHHVACRRAGAARALLAERSNDDAKDTERDDLGKGGE